MDDKLIEICLRAVTEPILAQAKEGQSIHVQAANSMPPLLFQEIG